MRAKEWILNVWWALTLAIALAGTHESVLATTRSAPVSDAPLACDYNRNPPIDIAPRPPAPPSTHDAVPDPAYTAHYRPCFPAAAIKAGHGGDVLLSVHVDASGSVLDVLVKKSTGYRELDASALDAARHWRFYPAERSGQAYATWVSVPVSFAGPTTRPSKPAAAAPPGTDPIKLRVCVKVSIMGRQFAVDRDQGLPLADDERKLGELFATERGAAPLKLLVEGILHATYEHPELDPEAITNEAYASCIKRL